MAGAAQVRGAEAEPPARRRPCAFPHAARRAGSLAGARARVPRDPRRSDDGCGGVARRPEADLDPDRPRRDRPRRRLGRGVDGRRRALSRRIARAGVRLWDAADGRAATWAAPQLSQLEVATGEGSVFAVRDEEHLIVASTPPEPTVGLIFYDLKTCLRNLRERPDDVGGRDTEGGRWQGVRGGVRPGDGSVRRHVVAAPPPRARAHARRPVLRRRLDAVARRRRAGGPRRSCRPAAAGLRRARAACPGRARPARARGARTWRATSCCAPAGARRSTSTSTASRRGPTCCATSARRWPSASEVEPDAVRIAGPELGAVALAASASLRGAAVRDRARRRQGVRDGQSPGGRRGAGRADRHGRGRRHERRRGPGGGRTRSARPASSARP